MKKLIYFILLMTLLFFVFRYLDHDRRIYIHSPDGKKTITLYLPFYLFHNKYYLIPYKYTSLMVPSDDYCRYYIGFGRDDLNDFYVNWYPDNKQKYISFPLCEKVENHFKTADNVPLADKFYSADEYYKPNTKRTYTITYVQEYLRNDSCSVCRFIIGLILFFSFITLGTVFSIRSIKKIQQKFMSNKIK